MATARTKRRSKNRTRGGNLVTIGIVAAVVGFVGAVTGILVSSSGTPTSTAVGGSGNGTVVTAQSSELAPTGEVSAMGVPVVETPGFTSGTTEAGGITVQGANWAMGQVPLDVAVRPFWTLTNTGSATVALGKPEAQIRQGCCPGPLVLGSSTLAPGESTVLTFELAMHEGMDGWHDMDVYVPVSDASGEQVLELNVTGDFRN